MMNCRIIDKNGYVGLENIRMAAYGIDETSLYFINGLSSGNMLPVGIYEDDKLVGGAYVSKSLSSLYIESIFINPEYQHKGYGKVLLNYIFANKKIFEDYFKKEFLYSRLEPNSHDITGFYESLGYSEPDDMNIMKKRI